MIKNLIFSGCSTKFFALIGCLKCLEDYNIINRKDIENIHCTSGSVLVLILYILGYSLKEIKDCSINLNMENVIYDKNNEQEIIDNLLLKKCFVNYDKIIDLLKNFIYRKINKYDISFKELQDISGINLIVNTYCLDDNKIVYFSAIDTPNMSIIDGILSTISIPVILQPVIYNGKTYSDPGITRHFDYDWFKDNDKNKLSNKYKKNEILGIIINSITETYKTPEYLSKNSKNYKYDYTDIYNYLKSIFNITVENPDYNKKELNYINIKFKLDFYSLNIHNDIKNKLILVGYKYTLDYINNL